MSATRDPATSWTGLLNSGRELYVDITAGLVKGDWLSRIDALLQSLKPLELLQAGEMIREALKVLPGN